MHVFVWMFLDMEQKSNIPKRIIQKFITSVI